jgi:hypothetical protein
VNRLVANAETAGAVVAVSLHFAAGARAADHFHPNDAGYTAIAESFMRVSLRFASCVVKAVHMLGLPSDQVERCPGSTTG